MKMQSLLLLVSAFFGTLFSIWLLLSCSSSAEVLRVELVTATVGDLVILLEAGTITSEQLIKEYVARIDENNYKGLELRAVLEIAPYDKLIEQARQYDLDRKEGKIRGPLHGIPILVKDNIATDPSLGMNTTAGSFALREFLY
jgi:amidase